MTKPSLTIAVLMFMSCLASPQVPAKDLFSIHVTKVKRFDEGCIAEAESAKVRFKISADMSGSCAMLRAGETYTLLGELWEVTRRSTPKTPQFLLFTTT